MPTTGVSTELVERVEDMLAAILGGREALIDLQVAVRGLRRRGLIDEGQFQELLDWLDVVAAANREGHQCAKWVRRHSEVIGG